MKIPSISGRGWGIRGIPHRYHTDTTPGFEAPPLILVDPRNQALEAAKQGLVAATFEALMIRSDEAFEGLAPPISVASWKI